VDKQSYDYIKIGEQVIYKYKFCKWLPAIKIKGKVWAKSMDGDGSIKYGLVLDGTPTNNNVVKIS